MNTLIGKIGQMAKKEGLEDSEGQIFHKPKKDRYLRARGGSSEFLNVYCSACRSFIALYQKDGPGLLLRMYLDRIFEPAELSELQNSVTDKNSMPGLKCPSCQTLIGTPMVYEPEDRLAFRLIRGSFFKKKGDGSYPSD